MKPHDYSMYLEFIKRYEPLGFQNIDRSDPFISEIERKLDHNLQFFHIQDLIKSKLLYVSSGIKKFIGIEPDEFDFSVMFTKLHPDDLSRYSLARTKLVKIGYEVLVNTKGFSIISSNYRLNDGTGKYTNVLFQVYLFHSTIPQSTVYSLLSFTNINHLEKGKHNYHFYHGNELNNFRYPDKSLLSMGRIFSRREYDILKLIAEGMDSQKIADTLFLSVNTVNTHRRNLLKKTKKSNTHELVIMLKETGVL